MLSVRLDEETERYLADILAREQISSRSELIKRLIRDRWLALQVGKTIVERRGGHPQNLLEDAPADLSERENRKKAIAKRRRSRIAAYLQQRHP